MKIREKAQIIIDILESHYPKTPIPLDHSDNFTLLIAVLLSAQCKDERVNQITPKLFKSFFANRIFFISSTIVNPDQTHFANWNHFLMAFVLFYITKNY